MQTLRVSVKVRLQQIFLMRALRQGARLPLITTDKLTCGK